MPARSSVTAPPSARSSSTEPVIGVIWPGMTARRLVDARRVAADRRRQHLADGVGDEVRTGEPGQAFVDATRTEQLLPAPGHRKDRDEDQERRHQDPLLIGAAEDVQRLTDVDLEEDVADRERRNDERRREAQARAHPAKRAWTRRRAAIASLTSSSEWAGENGSESTSEPARSVTGSGGCVGARRSSYALN